MRGGSQYKLIGKRIRDKPRLRRPSGSSQSRCMGAEREREEWKRVVDSKAVPVTVLPSTNSSHWPSLSEGGWAGRMFQNVREGYG